MYSGQSLFLLKHKLLTNFLASRNKKKINLFKIKCPIERIYLVKTETADGNVKMRKIIKLYK